MILRRGSSSLFAVVKKQKCPPHPQNHLWKRQQWPDVQYLGCDQECRGVREVKAEAAFTQMTWRFDPLGETALAL